MENTEEIPDREYIKEERCFYILEMDGDGSTDNPYVIDGVAFNGWYYEVGYECFVHCVDGVQHSDTTHALEDTDGTKIWMCQGKTHRLDGPAVEWADGKKEWYVHDALHRLDGPAIEWPDGGAEWWVDGTEVNILAVFGYVPSVPLTEGEQLILRLST